RAASGDRLQPQHRPLERARQRRTQRGWHLLVDGAQNGDQPGRNHSRSNGLVAGADAPMATGASPSRRYSTRAGTPTATLNGGRLLVTTLPAPTTHPSPMTTPSTILTPAPIHTSRPMRIPTAVSPCVR